MLKEALILTDTQLMEMRLFPFADVLAAVPGLRENTFQQWIARGVFNVSDQSPGSGRKRQFNLKEIVRIAVVNHLSAFDIGPRFSAQCGFAAVKRLVQLNEAKSTRTDSDALKPHKAIIYSVNEGIILQKLLKIREPFIPPMGEPISENEPDWRIEKVNPCYLVIPVDDIIIDVVRRLKQTDLISVKFF